MRIEDIERIQKQFDDYFNKLIQNRPPEKIAVAVSGGSDSVALLFLLSEWKKNFPQQNILHTNSTSAEAKNSTSAETKISCDIKGNVSSATPLENQCDIEKNIYNSTQNESSCDIQGNIHNATQNKNKNSAHITQNIISNIQIIVLTINHNLRIESKNEIEYVQSLARKLNHECYSLLWEHDGSKIALQARAREARYNLMANKCDELGCELLLTAHHLDDVMETYIMKKNKKSSLLGLQYSNHFFYQNIEIFRPLSNFTKKELINYLTSHSIKWCEDISNDSELYTRNIIRKELKQLDTDSKVKLLDEIKQVNSNACAFNHELIKEIAESVKIHNIGIALIDLRRFSNLKYDLQVQILHYILTIISGKIDMPRFRSSEKILEQIKLHQTINATLHRCVLKTAQNYIIVFKEKISITPEKLYLEKGINHWDNRFLINCASLHKDCYIEKLTLDDYIKIKSDINITNLKEISCKNHHPILFTLPVVKKYKKILAIPHILYYDRAEIECDFDITFQPGFLSRFIHYFNY